MDFRVISPSSTTGRRQDCGGASIHVHPGFPILVSPSLSPSVSPSSHNMMNMSLFKRLSSKRKSWSKYAEAEVRSVASSRSATTTTTTTTAAAMVTTTTTAMVSSQGPGTTTSTSNGSSAQHGIAQSRMEDDAPPAYSATPVPFSSSSEDSAYSFLAQFDTIFLIDDSGSMAGRSWRETCAALRAIAPICTAYDQDGIDIYFLNHRNPAAARSLGSGSRSNHSLGGYPSVTTAAGVDEIFQTVRPYGGTPTGTRLNQILKPYLAQLKMCMDRGAGGGAGGGRAGGDGDLGLKPLNIIVITDGVASDDVESVIVSAAKKLDSYGAEPWQVGIQFFQVGEEPEAAADLRDLDDALSAQHGIRDMVDTVPWTGGTGTGTGTGQTFTAEMCLKVTMGAVNRRLDRRQL